MSDYHILSINPTKDKLKVVFHLPVSSEDNVCAIDNTLVKVYENLERFVSLNIKLMLLDDPVHLLAEQGVGTQDRLLESIDYAVVDFLQVLAKIRITAGDAIWVITVE